MARPRDEQCPERGPGLTHVVDGDIVCVHCGQLTTRSIYDMIREIRDGLKRQEPEPEPDPETPPPGAETRPGLCQWQRGHIAPAVYLCKDRKHYCLDHYRRTVEIALWR